MQCDTNGDGVPDAREFAGSHRYNTAVALAGRFVKDAGAISTVILASGETEVDAVTASGLAGNLGAPVLLTRSNRLPHNVARFIDTNNVTNVIVVGGAASVPDAVVTAIEGLGSKPAVERVAGADRYATAAAIGERLGGPNPTWCNSTQTAAILVNGGAMGRADAIVAGPLASRLGLPVLLTAADELPESTQAFLTDNKVERVVIIGGTAAVSADVADDLVELVGVTHAQRITGATAAETSVMVAKEMLGNCASALGANRDMVALVNRDATADGITAAPVLGRGVGNSGATPILLVDDTLPAAVSDYLGSTANMRAGMKTHLRIVAIGGTAVVSNMVMNDALDAARTSDPLTAEITALKYTAAGQIPPGSGKSVGDYTTEFRVTFSDNVKLAADGPDAGEDISVAERRGTVQDPTLYFLNGRRLEALLDASTDPVNEETTVIRDLVFTADRTVTIKLSHHLDAGDRIVVCPNSDCVVGANKDMRKLQRAEEHLGAVTVARDRTAPTVDIIAVPGQGAFDVVITEPNPGYNELQNDNRAEFIAFRGVSIPGDASIAVGSAGNRPTPRMISITSAAPTVVTPVGASKGTLRLRFAITVANPTPAGRQTGQYPTPEVKLRAGDTITIKHAAVRDRGNLLSLSKQLTVPKIKTATTANGGTGDLKIERVSMGNHVHNKQASATFGADGSTLTIMAKPTGIAAGAPGNDWVMYGYDDRRDAASGSDAFSIDVDVDKANQRIAYTISDVLPRRSINRGATLEDLATALVSNSDFNDNFTVDYGDRPNQTKATLLGATAPQGVHFGATTETMGTTQVAVVVKFNADISTLAGSPAGDDLADGIAPLYDTTANPADAPDARFIVGSGTDDGLPEDMVHITWTSNSMRELPARTGFRVIEAGVATGYGDDTLNRGYGCTGTAAGTCAASSAGVASVRYFLTSMYLDSSIKPRASS